MNDISNILTLITLADRLAAQLASVMGTIGKARAEGRDVSDEEIDEHADAYDAASTTVYDEISRQRTEKLGTDTPA
jgi:hypothetical protein